MGFQVLGVVGDLGDLGVLAVLGGFRVSVLGFSFRASGF